QSRRPAAAHAQPAASVGRFRLGPESRRDVRVMRKSVVHGLGCGIAAFGLLVLAACSGRDAGAPAAPGAPAAGAGVTAFTGARLIVGDGTVIDNATFTLGPDHHFGVVGATAAVTVPAGATTVDLK